MEKNYEFEDIIEKLKKNYEVNGYVTENRIFDLVSEKGLSLDKIDSICDNILSIGILIRDESLDIIKKEDKINVEDKDRERYDWSKTDYNKIYEEVLFIEPNLLVFINYIRKIEPPQHREWQNLLPQVKNNNTFAKNRIFEMYLRTVIKTAYRYYQKYRISISDSIQEGCIGLIIALEKFEIAKHDKFSTYAPWWIRQRIERKSPILNRSFHYPAYIKAKLYPIFEVFDYSYGKNVNSCFISKDSLITICNKYECSKKEAMNYLKQLEFFESIEDLNEKNESFFSDNGIKEEEIYLSIRREEANTRIYSILKTLPRREEKVIKLRYGFYEEKIKTLSEIGKIMNVTRERIRQIECKAMAKIRHSSRKSKLEEFKDMIT